MATPTDVIELRLPGLVVRFDREWQAHASVPHGAFLAHGPTGLTIHVRDWHRAGDADWLRSELHAQNWLGPPTDIDERALDGRALIGGTFRLADSTDLVREWFVSDGRRSANAALQFPRDTPRDQLAPFERLLDAIELTGG